MSRRRLLSTLATLLVVMGSAASACTSIGSHGGTSGAAAPLVRLPETVNVEYGEISDIPPDAKAQTITFKDATGQPEGFALRTYPNSEHLSLMSWVSARWDPGRVLFLRPCRSVIGNCVMVIDSTTYQTNESPAQPDFPILAVVAVGDNVVAVDRLNGIPSQTPEILNLLGVVQQ
jgi:hypothetical protein